MLQISTLMNMPRISTLAPISSYGFIANTFLFLFWWLKVQMLSLRTFLGVDFMYVTREWGRGGPINKLSGREENPSLSLVVLADFCGVNSPTVASSKTITI